MFIQTIIVVMILGAVVILLLGINHLLSGNFDARQDDMDQLRKELEDSDRVISSKSSFHMLVTTGHTKKIKK